MEAEYMRKRIKEMDAELKTYESGQHGGLDESILSVLSPAERAKVTKAYEEQQKRLSAVLADLTVQPLAWFSQREANAVTKLNQDLQEVALHPESAQKLGDLRKRYKRALLCLPSIISILPAKAESLVWQAFGAGPHRDGDLAGLAHQKQQAGIPLSVDQSITAIEANWKNGNRGEALNLLQSLETGPQRNDLSVLRLKVFLFTDSRRYDDCLQTLKTIFELSPRHDPRVVMHLIIGASEGGRTHLSFAMYIWMRQRLGNDMTMQDYDALSLHYLVSGKKDLALAVFRDLMFSMMPADAVETKPAQGREEMKGLYDVVLGRLELLRSSSSSAEEANNLSMKALTALPASWQNKFFYASWLKKLIGGGHIDQAVMVVELMFERAIRPDAKHLNGLIGALFRTGLEADKAQAKTLGWTMIQRRLDFVQEQDKNGQLSEAIISARKETLISGPRSDPAWKLRKMPRANIETFCVLAEHYAVDQSMDQLPQLERLLEAARISMNTYFMNQRLVAMENASAHDLWDKVSNQFSRVQRDMQTFGILWNRQIELLVQVHRKKAEPGGFPTPRQLLAKTIRWSRHPGSANVEYKELERPWYETIIRCFCFRRDVSGVLVAMHALREQFGVFPDDETRRLLIVTVASLKNDAEADGSQRTGRVRLLGGRRFKPIEHTLDRVGAELDTLMRQRVARGALDADQGLNDINLLSEFLKQHMQRASGGKNAREGILKAKHEIGVEDITTGDVSVLDAWGKDSAQ
ncbi:hypothetical protein MBLNU230_g4741t1 [Neophaeotheca triangularis]